MSIQMIIDLIIANIPGIRELFRRKQPKAWTEVQWKEWLDEEAILRQEVRFAKGDNLRKSGVSCLQKAHRKMEIRSIILALVFSGCATLEAPRYIDCVYSPEEFLSPEFHCTDPDGNDYIWPVEPDLFVCREASEDAALIQWCYDR